MKRKFNKGDKVVYIGSVDYKKFGEVRVVDRIQRYDSRATYYLRKIGDAPWDTQYMTDTYRFWNYLSYELVKCSDDCNTCKTRFICYTHK